MTIAPLVALFLAQAHPDLQRVEAAQRLMDSGRCAEAIPMLKPLAAAHPEAPALKYGLGRCYFEVEDYPAAVRTLREAAASLPKSPEVRFFLGSALGVSGNAPEAIQELRVAIELDPKFEPAYRAFGMFRVQRGQYAKDAIEALETAVRLNPKDARAWYWAGKFHLGAGDPARARQPLERAHELDPEDPPTRLALGQVLLSDGEIDHALSYFDSVLAFEPALVPALLGRARALYYKGQAAQALVPAEEAHKGARGFEDERAAAWIVSRVYRALGRDTEAETAERQLQTLEAAFAGELSRIRELSDQAARFEAEHKTDKVAETLEAFLKLRETGEVLVRLGDAYLELGRFGDAERCFVRASQVGPLTEPLKQRLKRARERRP